MDLNGGQKGLSLRVVLPKEKYCAMNEAKKKDEGISEGNAWFKNKFWE